MHNSIRPVAAFTLGYIGLATVFAFRTQNWEFVFYIIVMLVLALLVASLHRRVNLSKGALWCLSIWGLLHMMGGLVPVPDDWLVSGDKHVLYSWWIIPNYFKYDQFVHSYGFGIATWVSWQTLHALLPKSLPTAGVLTLCLLAGMGLGALNEIIEFVATLLIPNTNVGGYTNTGWDLIANMIGAIVAALVIYHFQEKRRKQLKHMLEKVIDEVNKNVP